MASFDSLPPDQRAVLQLILKQGRTYDDIARMLSIDPGAVRQRALAAFEALGPQTRIGGERRTLITDYLLGQLPPRESDEAREGLARSPGERAWARVLAGELSSVARDSLPEIPTEDATPSAPTDAVASPPKREKTAERPSSRVGGAVLLGLGIAIAAVVVILVLVTGGSDKSNQHAASPTSTPPTATTATPTATTSTPTATTSTPTAPTSTPTATTPATTGTATRPTSVVAQVNLLSPGGAASPVGVAQVVKQGANNGVVVVASGIPPNTRADAYAVWLFKPPSKSKILGFVNPAVGTSGRLQTGGPLPTDAAQYTELLVTREMQATPKAPGTIILQGNLNLH